MEVKSLGFVQILYLHPVRDVDVKAKLSNLCFTPSPAFSICMIWSELLNYLGRCVITYKMKVIKLLAS